MGDNESCGICCDRPRAVCNQPCGHGGFCELCTVKLVQACVLNCSICRCTVQKLVVFPVTATAQLPSAKRMRMDQVEPRPQRMPTFRRPSAEVAEGRTFESIDAFLLAKLDSDDAEVVEAARAALARVSGQGQGGGGEGGGGGGEVGGGNADPLFPINAQGHATVSEGATELPDYAFMDCTSLISISLPASLTRIGKGAFDGCASLALTSLPECTTSIGNHAFMNCASLVLTSLPEGIISIGNHAFMNCASLVLTNLPDGITSIGYCAFADCASLALTRLPEGITSIGHGAFEGSGFQG